MIEKYILATGRGFFGDSLSLSAIQRAGEMDDVLAGNTGGWKGMMLKCGRD